VCTVKGRNKEENLVAIWRAIITRQKENLEKLAPRLENIETQE